MARANALRTDMTGSTDEAGFTNRAVEDAQSTWADSDWGPVETGFLPYASPISCVVLIFVDFCWLSPREYIAANTDKYVESAQGTNHPSISRNWRTNGISK